MGKKCCSNGQKIFFRSAKETSKVIPDNRGTGKVVPMKKRTLCFGCLSRYLQKYLEWILRSKSLKKLAIGERNKSIKNPIALK